MINNEIIITSIQDKKNKLIIQVYSKFVMPINNFKESNKKTENWYNELNKAIKLQLPFNALLVKTKSQIYSSNLASNSMPINKLTEDLYMILYNKYHVSENPLILELNANDILRNSKILCRTLPDQLTVDDILDISCEGSMMIIKTKSNLSTEVELKKYSINFYLYQMRKFYRIYEYALDADKSYSYNIDMIRLPTPSTISSTWLKLPLISQVNLVDQSNLSKTQNIMTEFQDFNSMILTSVLQFASYIEKQSKCAISYSEIMNLSQISSRFTKNLQELNESNYGLIEKCYECLLEELKTGDMSYQCTQGGDLLLEVHNWSTVVMTYKSTSSKETLKEIEEARAKYLQFVKATYTTNNLRTIITQHHKLLECFNLMKEGLERVKTSFVSKYRKIYNELWNITRINPEEKIVLHDTTPVLSSLTLETESVTEKTQLPGKAASSDVKNNLKDNTQFDSGLSYNIKLVTVTPQSFETFHSLCLYFLEPGKKLKDLPNNVNPCYYIENKYLMKDEDDMVDFPFLPVLPLLLNQFPLTYQSVHYNNSVINQGFAILRLENYTLHKEIKKILALMLKIERVLLVDKQNYYKAEQILNNTIAYLNSIRQRSLEIINLKTELDIVSKSILSVQDERDLIKRTLPQIISGELTPTSDPEVTKLIENQQKFITLLEKALTLVDIAPDLYNDVNNYSLKLKHPLIPDDYPNAASILRSKKRIFIHPAMLHLTPVKNSNSVFTTIFTGKNCLVYRYYYYQRDVFLSELEQITAKQTTSFIGFVLTFDICNYSLQPTAFTIFFNLNRLNSSDILSSVK